MVMGLISCTLGIEKFHMTFFRLMIGSRTSSFGRHSRIACNVFFIRSKHAYAWARAHIGF